GYSHRQRTARHDRQRETQSRAAALRRGAASAGPVAPARDPHRPGTVRLERGNGSAQPARCAVDRAFQRALRGCVAAYCPERALRRVLLRRASAAARRGAGSAAATGSAIERRTREACCAGRRGYGIAARRRGIRVEARHRQTAPAAAARRPLGARMNTHARGILVVAARREDRRALFDALDGQGYGPILSARDIPHARNLLAESPSPRLAVLDFCTMPAESAAFGAELQGVPVIGLLGAAREHDGERISWNFRHRPPGVVEWLRTPVDAMEARARTESVLHGEPLQKGVDQVADTDDYRCIFESSPDGLLFSDAQSGAVLEVNAAFEAASGFGAAQVVGTTLEELFALDATQREFLHTHLRSGGEARLQCEQWRADGSRRPVEIATRLLKRGGELVHFTSVRDARALRDGRELLDALSKMSLPDEREGALQRRLARFAAVLRFDYVALAAQVGGERQLQAIASSGRLPLSQGTLDPLTEPAVHMAAGV